MFLLVFFLVPFAFAFKISFAESAAHVPPFTDVLVFTPDHHLKIAATLDNYRYLLTDEVYGVSYLYSLRTAFFATLVCLALGYPMAYAIARSPRATQGVLLLVIMLPFWTSFLLRVYALEGIIRDNGLLNTVLLQLGLIHRAAAASCAPTSPFTSASSIPICRSWCCRCSRRWRSSTRRCSRRPPTSAARRGGRSST